MHSLECVLGQRFCFLLSAGVFFPSLHLLLDLPPTTKSHSISLTFLIVNILLGTDHREHSDYAYRIKQSIFSYCDSFDRSQALNKRSAT